jgi:ABC-type nitrate/sulfonate/bicarbonate transport system substrate-binding protein
MMPSRTNWRMTTIAALACALATPASAQTKLTLVTFAGASNLPVWIALDKGLFAREGLDVTQEITRGSTPAIQGLMSGRYQIAASAMDNTIAVSEGQGDVEFDNYDVISIYGIHSGMNKIVTRPEIKSYADIKGKAVAADALTSGYGLMLFKIIALNGLVLNKDYTALAVGSGPNRLAAMKEGKAVAAAVSAPEDLEAKRLGFNIVADAVEQIGAYQGSVFMVKQSWAKEHEKEVLGFIRAEIAATDYAFADKAGAMAVLKNHMKQLCDDDLAYVYNELVNSKGGLNRAGRMNMDGVKMLLTLRNELSGAERKLTDPEKYVDLTYYQKAAAR